VKLDNLLNICDVVIGQGRNDFQFLGSRLRCKIALKDVQLSQEVLDFALTGPATPTCFFSIFSFRHGLIVCKIAKLSQD
jgi:hypothetical protein